LKYILGSLRDIFNFKVKETFMFSLLACKVEVDVTVLTYIPLLILNALCDYNTSISFHTKNKLLKLLTLF